MADNRTHFVVGSGQFINNDEALFTWEKFDVLTHLQNAGDAEEVIIDQWNEDGIMADFRFSIDTTKNVVINSLRLALVISNGTNTVELDSVNVVLNPNIGSPPQIATNDIRNYILPVNSEFNLVKIDNDGTALPKEFYRGIIGQKITWQEWIRNNNIPALFLNFSQLNNGLNQKADNYSGENGYDIYLKATAEVTGDDSVQGRITRAFDRLSSLINVYDYFESDDGVIINGVIETWDASETTNLNGAILPFDDTLFKVIWSGAAPLALANLGYIIHRIEPINTPTNLQIEESSTFRGIVPNGKLTAVTTAQAGATIVSRCFIKGGSLTNGNWKLSARIKMPGLPSAFAWILIHHTNSNGRNAVFTSRADILTNNKTFFSVNNATVSADFRFRIGNTDTNLNDANDFGWTAFAEIDFTAFISATIPAGSKVRVSYTGTNTSDTDLLTAIKVSVDENIIATTTNTVFVNSKTAASGILLPFQTDNDINLVVSQFTTNKFSAKRTNLEISDGEDLTDFVGGLTNLTGLGLDANGHLFVEPTSANHTGQISIQSTANDANEGSVVGIASPLQNFAYPVTGDGSNILSKEYDEINDRCNLLDPDGYIFSNTLDFASWVDGQSCTFFVNGFSNGAIAEGFFGAANRGFGADRFTIYVEAAYLAAQFEGSLIPTTGYYRNCFVITKITGLSLNVKFYKNGRLHFSQTKNYNASLFTGLKNDYLTNRVINLENPTVGANRQLKRISDTWVLFDTPTNREITEFALGNITFTPNLHWDFKQTTGATVPETVTGRDATLTNTTNLRTNYFV